MRLTRRSMLAGVAGTTPALAAFAASARGDVMDGVRERARRLAREAFEDHRINGAARLGYDDYRKINYRRERSAFGGDSRFRLQPFHLGYIFDRPVGINVVRGERVRPLSYVADDFDMGRNIFNLEGLQDSFAGFRINYPLNTAATYDELISFLGASYFRFLGRGQRYGLSARGLSIRSGQPDEEFPFFREFWVEESRDVESVRVWALMDSPSLTGAYQFAISPGKQTTVAVGATLYARRSVSGVGLAPLTSMFDFGKFDRGPRTDYRPQVHDSDGLVFRDGADWFWRPLHNPAEHRVSRFPTANLRGFGLCQRDRVFQNYQDLEARYDLRPTYWVEPIGDWPGGEVVLVELATDSEFHDNIVASWNLPRELGAGQSMSFQYRMSAILDQPLHKAGRAIASFQSPRPDDESGLEVKRVAIDFAGVDLVPYLDAPEVVSVAVEVAGGRSLSTRVEANRPLRGLRAHVDIGRVPRTAGSAGDADSGDKYPDRNMAHELAARTDGRRASRGAVARIAKHAEPLGSGAPQRLAQ